MEHSSARETLLTHLPLQLLKNALKNATRLWTASGSPLRRLMITAFSTRSVMTNLIVRHVLAERRNVPMGTKVSISYTSLVKSSETLMDG